MTMHGGEKNLGPPGGTPAPQRSVSPRLESNVSEQKSTLRFLHLTVWVLVTVAIWTGIWWLDHRSSVTVAEGVGWVLVVALAIACIALSTSLSRDVEHTQDEIEKLYGHIGAASQILHRRLDDLVEDVMAEEWFGPESGETQAVVVVPEEVVTPEPVVSPPTTPTNRLPVPATAIIRTPNRRPVPHPRTEPAAKVLVEHWADEVDTERREIRLPDGSSHVFQFRSQADA